MAGKFLVYWYGHHPALHANQSWYLNLNCRYCHYGVSEPHWLLAKGDKSSASVNSKKVHFLVSQPQGLSLLGLREFVQQSIAKAILSPDLAAIIAALSVGSRALLSHQDWQVFQNTGTSHLVAISGLHVGFIFWVMRWLCFWLWTRSCYLIGCFPAPLAADAGALGFAIGHGFLAGLSLPTQRALLMLLFWVLPKLFYQAVPVSHRLLLAFLVTVLLEPLCVFQMGFWLSYGAVAAIGYATVDADVHHRMSSAIKMQISITLLLIPISLFDFQKVSLISIIANVIAVPYITFCIVPLCFFSTLVLMLNLHYGLFLFKVAAFLLKPLWIYLSFLAALHFATVTLQSVHIGILFAAELGFILLLLPRGLQGKWLGLLFIAPLCSQLLGP